LDTRSKRAFHWTDFAEPSNAAIINVYERDRPAKPPLDNFYQKDRNKLSEPKILTLVEVGDVFTPVLRLSCSEWLVSAEL
jgi:hypothetical protein